MLHQHRDLLVLALALEPFLPELCQDPIQIAVGEITRVQVPVRWVLKTRVPLIRVIAQTVNVDGITLEIRDTKLWPASELWMNNAQVGATWVCRCVGHLFHHSRSPFVKTWVVRDKIHHIIYHWTEEKHPQKINLVWKLWKENRALRRQVQ
eukprot:COSAG04_NODE_2274_length_4412_cov_2.410851_3_plen_151_part_00